MSSTSHWSETRSPCFPRFFLNFQEESDESNLDLSDVYFRFAVDDDDELLGGSAGPSPWVGADEYR